MGPLEWLKIELKQTLKPFFLMGIVLILSVLFALLDDPSLKEVVLVLFTLSLARIIF